MRFCRLFLALVIIYLISPVIASGADGHQVLILDIGRQTNGRAGSNQHRILLVEIETGKVRAEVKVGHNTNLALAPKGDVLAALSYQDGKDSLSFYRTNDLTLLQRGLLPPHTPRFTYQQGAARDSWFSPDGQVLLLCGLEGEGNVDQATAVLTSVTRQLDSHGVFVPRAKRVKVHPCRGFGVVSAAAWPRLHLLDYTFTLLDVADVNTGRILSRLPLGDDDVPLDKPKQEDLDRASMHTIEKMRNQGHLVAGADRYAYYLPFAPHPNAEPERRKPGALKKLDLGVDPPKIVCAGKEREVALNIGVAAVVESRQALFVLRQKYNAQRTHEASHWVEVFNTGNLVRQATLTLPLADCQALEGSKDGKLLYALDPETGKLAALDIATGGTVKILEGIGTFPYLVFALPEAREGKYPL